VQAGKTFESEKLYHRCYFTPIPLRFSTRLINNHILLMSLIRDTEISFLLQTLAYLSHSPLWNIFTTSSFYVRHGFRKLATASLDYTNTVDGYGDGQRFVIFRHFISKRRNQLLAKGHLFPDKGKFTVYSFMTR
jgi:hypothetical protein